MTPEQIEALSPAFAAYLEQFRCCCDYPRPLTCSRSTVVVCSRT